MFLFALAALLLIAAVHSECNNCNLCGERLCPDENLFTIKYSIYRPTPSDQPYIELYFYDISTSAVVMDLRNVVITMPSINKEYTLAEVPVGDIAWGIENPADKVFRSPPITSGTEYVFLLRVNELAVKYYFTTTGNFEGEDYQCTCVRNEIAEYIDPLVHIAVFSNPTLFAGECINMFYTLGAVEFVEGGDCSPYNYALVTVPYLKEYESCINILASYQLFGSLGLPTRTGYAPISIEDWNPITRVVQYKIPLFTHEESIFVKKQDYLYGGIFALGKNCVYALQQTQYITLQNANTIINPCSIRNTYCARSYEKVSVSSAVLNLETKQITLTLGNVCGNCFIDGVNATIVAGPLSIQTSILNIPAICNYCSICPIQSNCSACSYETTLDVVFQANAATILALSNNNYEFDLSFGTDTCHYFDIEDLTMSVISSIENTCDLHSTCVDYYDNLVSGISITGFFADGCLYYVVMTKGNRLSCSKLAPVLELVIDNEIFTVTVRSSSIDSGIMTTILKSKKSIHSPVINAVMTLNYKKSYYSEPCVLGHAIKPVFVREGECFWCLNA